MQAGLLDDSPFFGGYDGGLRYGIFISRFRRLLREGEAGCEFIYKGIEERGAGGLTLELQGPKREKI